MIKLENINKIYVLGDLHLGVKNNSIEWSEIQSDFLLNFFLSKIDENGFDPDHDILIQLGDWNHIREYTNVRIWNKSIEIFKKLSYKFKRGIFIILGNHDVYYKDKNSVHSLKGISNMFPNITIFESPEIIEVNKKYRFLMLPWIENNNQIINEINLYKGKIDYIFCHADIKGFKLNKFSKLESGIDPSNLREFKKIYSGHIHIRQEDKNILYVGTPYHMDKGDLDNIKGFYILNCLDSMKETFIENTISPKYVRYNIIDILNLSLSEINELFKNNFVDLLIEYSFFSKFPVNKFLDIIKDSNYRQLEFITYSKENEKDSKNSDSNKSYEYNIFEILNSILDEKSISNEIREKVIKKFNNLYSDLKNNKLYQ